jgi:hypothetical protein
VAGEEMALVAGVVAADPPVLATLDTTTYGFVPRLSQSPGTGLQSVDL